MYAEPSQTTTRARATGARRVSAGSYCPVRPRLDKLFLRMTFCLIATLGAGAAIGKDTGALQAGEAARSQLLRGEAAAAAATARTGLETSPGHARLVQVLALADSTAVFAAQPDADLAAGVRLAGADDHEAALAKLAAARDAYAARGDSLGRLVTIERLALSWMAAHDYGAAEEALPATVDLAESLAQPLAAARAHLNLGRVLVRGRQMDEATGHLETALATADAHDIAPWQADAHLALSIISRLRMDLDTSLFHREAALEAYTRAGDLAGQARCLQYIGTIHIFKGDLTRAASMLHQGEAMAREAGEDEVLSGILGGLAGIDYLIGNYDNALAQYAEATRLAGDPRRRGWYLLNSGSILAYQGRHQEALEVYEEAHAAMIAADDHRNVSTILQVKGQSLCELKRYDEGLVKLDEAIAYARAWEMPLEEAYALHFKGHALLDLERLDEAAAALTAAADMAATTGYFDITESALLGRAKVARAQGRLDEALSHLEQAVDIVTTVRRRSGGSAGLQSGYFSQVGRSFEEMISVLGELHARHPEAGYDRRAFDIAQMAKARSLLDMLAEAEVDLRVRAGEDYQAREAEILGGIAEMQEALDAAAPDSAAVLEAEIARLESRLDLLEAELREADPRYAELRYPRPCTLAEAQAMLREAELLLEFQLGKEESHLFVAVRAGFHMVTLPPREEIESLVRELLPMLQDYNVTGADAVYYGAVADELARLLLDPVSRDIFAAHRLLIVPDGALHYLPFEALPLGPSATNAYAEMPFLARSRVVSYAPSVSTLQRLRAAPGAAGDTGGLMIVGDPVQPSPEEASVFARVAGAAGLRPVPHVKDELRELIACPFSPMLMHFGEAANAAALSESPQSAGCRYLHFAAHGLFNEQSPQFSGLALSPDPDNGDDGFLSVSEIFALDLDCEQVTLSACSTALGEQIDGEGLVGLTRAFMYAGARGVVAALWDIPGLGAATFMSDYYRRLADGDGSAAALAATKRRMIDGGTVEGLDLAHPALWAAFVLSGGSD